MRRTTGCWNRFVGWAATWLRAQPSTICCGEIPTFIGSTGFATTNGRPDRRQSRFEAVRGENGDTLMAASANNPFGKYNGNEGDYVLQALDSEDPGNKERPWVQRFEEAFAEKVGAKYAIAVNSGTS